MGFLRRQLLKIIQWEDSSSDTIIYRYPMTDRDEIMNGCQLIVRPSQTAILVSSGQICDVYGEGEHKLTTNNMPIITNMGLIHLLKQRFILSILNSSLIKNGVQQLK